MNTLTVLIVIFIILLFVLVNSKRDFFTPTINKHFPASGTPNTGGIFQNIDYRYPTGGEYNEGCTVGATSKCTMSNGMLGDCVLNGICMPDFSELQNVSCPKKTCYSDIFD